MVDEAIRKKLLDTQTVEEAKKLIAGENIEKAVVELSKEKQADAMKKAIKAKFDKNEELRGKLLTTAGCALKLESSATNSWYLYLIL